jgi:metal-sulfur cluster biosynthetic enzyme
MDREDAAIIADVRDLANRIPDPCGLAQALSIGMVDMGLVRSVEAVREHGAWNITVRARVTSPECLHFVYFERELRAALGARADIGQVHIEWDSGLDWLPEDMSEAARARLRERRHQIAAVAGPT